MLAPPLYNFGIPTTAQCTLLEILILLYFHTILFMLSTECSLSHLYICNLSIIGFFN